MSVFAGVLLHATGASAASLCYVPQRKTTGWAWQTFWLAQAFVCWLLLPIIGAWLTIPHLNTVLNEMPTGAAYRTFFLGLLYGIGGTAFGLAIRYIGFSLNYAIAVGLSCVLGTLLPPIIHRQLAEVFSKTGAGWIVAGLIAGIAGIALCGVSGRLKEKNLVENSNEKPYFNLAKGIPLCLLAGVLSAVYGLALDQGQPIADVAAKYGAGNFQGNVIYIFANSGAFISTMLYCLYLHKKENTFSQYKILPSIKNSNPLQLNFLMACLTGFLWYSQFFFYGLGHQQLGNYKFTSWAIHMIMLVLFSSVTGLVLREWINCKPKTIQLLSFALFVLIAAVLLLSYGNYVGS